MEITSKSYLSLSSCSVIESQVLKSCGGCNLKFICKKIDEIVGEYTDNTTFVTDSFSFGN